MNNKIIIGDLHLKLNTKELASELKDQIIAYMSKKAMTETGTDLVIVGDTYNDKAIIRDEVQDYFLNWLRSIKSYFTKIICITGNHDLDNKDSDKSPLEIFTSIINNFYYVSKHSIDNESFYIGYKNSFEDFSSCLKKVSSDIKYIFCHQGFNGFKMNGSNIVCHDGFDCDIFPKNVKIFSGHFHEPQCKNNLTYVGSCWSQDFSESNQEKRFISIDCENKIESVKIKDIRKHIDCLITVDRFDESCKKNIDKQFDKLNKKDIIRWKITGNKADVDDVIKYVMEKNSEYNLSLSLKANYTYSEKSFVIKDDMTPIDMLDRYIDFNSERFSDVSLVELKKKGLEYLL